MFSKQHYFYKIKDWMVIENIQGQRYLISAKGFHFLEIIRDYYRRNHIQGSQTAVDLLPLNDDPEYKQFVSFLDQIGFLQADVKMIVSNERTTSNESAQGFSRNDKLYNELQKDIYLKHLPNKVQMEIESLCNFDCKYCVRGGSVPYNSKLMLTLHDYKKLFDEFEKIGISELTFSGGEPFLREDINDILMLTSDYGFKVRIFTNASLITPSNIEVMKQLRLVGVQVGLYGVKEDYPTFTGVDAFDDAWSGINLLKEAGIPMVLSCPITKINRSSFQFFKSLEKDYHVHYNHLISPPKKQLPRDASPEFLLDVDDEFLNQVVQLEEARELEPNSDAQCIIGHNFICIDIIGNVFPCYNYPLPIGNLHHRNLESIWFNNPDLDRLREINFSDVFAKCRSCETQPYCIRCMAYNLLLTGNIEELNSFTCNEGKFIMELNKRKAAAVNDKS
jgi:radical SAM protein with 4Fe4S-binding SPASM domain